jgi:hypothetical protein
MFACYYFAAGFWKLNTHFWDPNASCGTVFFVQLVANYMIAVPNTIMVSLSSAWYNTDNGNGSSFLLMPNSLNDLSETAATTTTILQIAHIAKHMAPRN